MSAKNTNSHLRVQMLFVGAMRVALAQVLSYIKLMERPNGGSLTPAMFPIILFAVRWGLTPGLMAGFTFGLLQLIFDGAYAWGWQSMLLDYLVALMVLGPAEFFARPFKNRMVGVAVGTAIAGFLRVMCSFLSGVLVWGNLNEGLSAWTYSLVYNASYMLPETLITVVGAVLLIKAAPQIFDRQYTKA